MIVMEYSSTLMETGRIHHDAFISQTALQRHTIVDIMTWFLVVSPETVPDMFQPLAVCICALIEAVDERLIMSCELN